VAHLHHAGNQKNQPAIKQKNLVMNQKDHYSARPHINFSCFCAPINPHTFLRLKQKKQTLMVHAFTSIIQSKKLALTGREREDVSRQAHIAQYKNKCMHRREEEEQKVAADEIKK